MLLSHAWIVNVATPYCMGYHVTQKVISLELMLGVAITHTATGRRIQARHITYTDKDIDHAAAYPAPETGLSAFTTTTKPHYIHSFCRLNRHP